MSVAEAPFERIRHGKTTVWVHPHQREALLEAGLGTADGWRQRLREARPAGRGKLATLELGSVRLVLKQLRRGGVLRHVWRDRFFGSRRLQDNLRIPQQLQSRGIATPQPQALCTVQGPPGLFQGFVALEAVNDAQDLQQSLRSSTPPTTAEFQAVVQVVKRAHEAGLEHRDLNLGNLMLRRGDGDRPEVWVIDLDGARLHPGPLPFHLRQRALRRLERSLIKTLHASGDEVASGCNYRDSIYDAYAGDDAALLARLRHGRRLGNLWIRLHQLRW